MEGLLSGLAFAALSALTYLAYKHQDSYRRIAGPLVWAATAIWFLPFLWQMGRKDGSRSIMDFVPLADRDAARQIVDGSLFTSPIWTIGYVAFALYTMFLMSFPFWLYEEKPVDEPGKKEGE